MLSNKMREQILEDLQQGCSVSQIHRDRRVSKYLIRKVKNEERIAPYRQKRLLEDPVVHVRKFRCPICRTLNTIKAERDDKICFSCMVRLRKQGTASR